MEGLGAGLAGLAAVATEVKARDLTAKHVLELAQALKTNRTLTLLDLGCARVTCPHGADART